MSILLIQQVINLGAVQAATTSSVPEEDSIILGGQAFAVSGPIQGQPVSDFEQGFKTGRLKYDNREHAFFLAMDDFSGGFGHRFLDLDTDQGTFWDVNPLNAPDTRRPGHLTLGPSMTITNLPPLGSNLAVQNASVVTRNILRVAGEAIISVGDSIYIRNGTANFTKVYNSGGSSGPGAALAILPAIDGSTSRILAFWPAGGNGYAISSDAIGSSWSPGAGNDQNLTDGLFWDNKVIAALGNNAIVFGVWDTNPVSGSPREIWNNEDTDDGQLIFYDILFQQLTFIGSFQASWGPAVYFFDRSTGIWALDFFARKASPVDAGLTEFVQYAIPWDGSLVFTDGWNVRLFSQSQAKQVTPINVPNEGGIPQSMVSGSHRASITVLIASDNYLYAACRRTHSNGLGSDTFLMCYNGVGWAPIGEVIYNFSPLGGIQFDAFGASSEPPYPRTIMVPGHQAIDNTSNKNVSVVEVNIPPVSQAPVVGLDTFAAGGAYLVTGWYDGGFSDMYGTLFRMSIDAYSLSATETVKVEFQLDNAAESDPWIQMVNAGNVAATFSDTVRTLYFPPPVGLDNPKAQRGITFRTCRFRITLNRGDDDTLSPEVRSLILVYLKTPPLRTQWKCRIDVNRMIERSAAGNDSGGYAVDGNPATISNVWAKLSSFWNTHPLLDFTLPGTDESLLVRITEMPITFDDFKDSIDGRGFIDLVLLEPVNA